MKRACSDGDVEAVLRCLVGGQGGVNGPQPLDYVADRPIHELLNVLPYVTDDAVFRAVLEAAFAAPGLSLQVRSLDGFLAQSICRRGWSKERIRAALEALAAARNVEPRVLFTEVAKIADKDTHSCLYRALMRAIESRDVEVVRELVAMGAGPSEKELTLLTADPDKDDELQVIKLRGSKQVRAQLLRIVNQEAEQEEEQDERPRRATRGRAQAQQDAPEPKKKKHRGPRQYFK